MNSIYLNLKYVKLVFYNFLLYDYNKGGVSQMIYSILGCIIGVFSLINTAIMFFAKKEKIWIAVLNLFCSIGFIGMGITGFCIPEKYNIIPIILLLVFSVVYLVLNTVVLNKRKAPQTGKTNSCKK